MDTLNRFHTKGNYLHMRLEHVAVMLLCAVSVLRHFKEVNWWHFAVVFIAIDLVGYIPGAIRYHRQGGGPIPKLYHVCYDIMHSYLTAMIIVGFWAFQSGGLEWAMLAFPIHLSGDRGIFGNVFKPSSLPFEPSPVDKPWISF
jgi:uncharacterized membrane protein